MAFFDSYVIYFVSALFGGSMMILQFVMMLFGFGGDINSGGDVDGLDGGDVDVGDAEHPSVGHSDSIDLFKVISLRTIVAGIAFFGLGGLVGLTWGFGELVSFILAIAFGLLAVYAVYYLYATIARMKSDGSISEKTLVGSPGNVYLRIPAAGGGAGKVLVTQQERTMEYEAISTGEEIKTGTPIIVIRIVSPTTVEVRPV